MSKTVSAAARPATVTASFYIWLVTILLGLVGAVLLFLLSGSAEVTAATQGNEAVGAAALIFAAVIAIIVAAVQLIFVFQMNAGKNWARIVLLVLAALQVLGVVAGGGTANWASWLGLGATIVATVLMFLPASNPYFRRTAA
jgi:cell division protein FtsW (lipid II flippase)